MLTIKTSLACQNCGSTNIQSSSQIYDKKIEKIEYYDDVPATKITKKKLYNCKCNVCGHTYTVDYGTSEFILFESPQRENCSDDVDLIAFYETDFGFNYKICSIISSSYDKNIKTREKIYLMLIEGEEYPVLLSKQTVDEMIEDNDNGKARTLIFNTLMSRNR